jgi:hypothetical protein
MRFQALELKGTVLRKEHPDILTSMNYLALVLSQQGKYEQAEETQKPLRPVKQHKNGREWPDVFDKRGDLNDVCFLEQPGSLPVHKWLMLRLPPYRTTFINLPSPSTSYKIPPPR